VTTISPLTEADLPAVVALMEEMDRFYGVTEFEPLEARQAQVNAALFRDHPAAHVLLACEGDQVVGLASYSYLWPAIGLTQSLFLKELYVAQTHRRHGIARQLMRYLFELATETGCSRIEWMTEQANVEARTFYASLGHAHNTEKVFFRVQTYP
jgi:GNAT superfamily N-acetyltransferase